MEEASTDHAICFVRSGFFLRQVGRVQEAADATQALFFPRDEAYRVHHPIDGGDECLVVVLDDALLADAIAELGEEPAGREARLPSGHVRLDPTQSVRLSRLFARARAGGDSLAVEESACRLALDVLAARRTERAPRSRDVAERRERVAAVQSAMTLGLGQRLTLASLAASVDWSPFQLLRAFRLTTGLPVHRYLTDLRVAAALTRLADGATDLTSLALDCGFSDHSHFTNVFRDRTALTPSAARALISR